jgi:hypothetical protein
MRWVERKKEGRKEGRKEESVYRDASVVRRMEKGIPEELLPWELCSCAGHLLEQSR